MEIYEDTTAMSSSPTKRRKVVIGEKVQMVGKMQKNYFSIKGDEPNHPQQQRHPLTPRDKNENWGVESQTGYHQPEDYHQSHTKKKVNGTKSNISSHHLKQLTMKDTLKENRSPQLVVGSHVPKGLNENEEKSCLRDHIAQRRSELKKQPCLKNSETDEYSPCVADDTLCLGPNVSKVTTKQQHKDTGIHSDSAAVKTGEKPSLRDFIAKRRAELQTEPIESTETDAINKGDSTTVSGSSTITKHTNYSLPSVEPSSCSVQNVSRRNGAFMDLSNIFLAESPDKEDSTAECRSTAATEGKKSSNHSHSDMNTNEALPVAYLGNFQESLWMDFGDDGNIVGRARSLAFLLRAPKPEGNNARVQHHTVEFERIPFKKGFDITVEDSSVVSKDSDATPTILTISSGEEVRLQLTWTPTEPGGLREVMYLKLRRGRLRITVQGSARALANVKKKISGKSQPALSTAKKANKGRTKNVDVSTVSKGPVLSHKKSHRNGVSRADDAVQNVATTVRGNATASIFKTPAVSKKKNRLCITEASKFRTPDVRGVKTPATSSFATPRTVYSKSSPGSNITTAMKAREKTLFDENWAEKQCNSFSKFFNYLLIPSEDQQYEESGLGHQIEEEMDTTWMDRAALRTLLIHRRNAQLRQRATELYESKDMKNIRRAIEMEVAENRLSIRVDRDVFADLGLRNQITSLLLSYSTEWLKLGLETVFGESISTNSISSVVNAGDTLYASTPASKVSTSTPASNVVRKQASTPAVHGNKNQSRNIKSKVPMSRKKAALKKFVVTRVLSDPHIARKYTRGKCKIPSGIFEKKYKAELRKITLRRILLLVAFLDGAKQENMLDRFPRLFTKYGLVKSSREVLVAICRDYLSGEGDIIKHLSHIGFTVSYKQLPIDEYDFSINNLAIDLRDGIRLARIVEILTNDKESALVAKMRLPAVSRLQKLHNVGVALSALATSGVANIADISAHHVVDGHRPKVLKLLWSIIAHYQLSSILDANLLETEIQDVYRANRKRREYVAAFLTRASSVGEMSPQDTHEYEGNVHLIKLLLKWCQAVCSCFGYNIENFTTSFADGKALCLLIHYYHPGILRKEEILPTTRDLPDNFGAEAQTEWEEEVIEHSISDEQYENALHNERHNSAVANKRMSELGGIPGMLPVTDSVSIPEEKSMILCLAYLCSRLMESSKEILATMVIQRCYRRYQGTILKEQKELSALIIFSFWQKNKEKYFECQRSKYSSSVRVIENFLYSKKKKLKLMQAIRLEWIKQSKAACVLQCMVRRYKSVARLQSLLAQYQAGRTIQSQFRMYTAQKKFRIYKQQHYASIILQCSWRCFRARSSFSISKKCAICIQSFYRGYIARSDMNNKKSSAVIIQSAWRCFYAQLLYSYDLMDIILVQSIARQRAAHNEMFIRQESVIIIQCMARNWIAVRKVISLLDERDDLNRMTTAALIIQKNARKCIATDRFQLLRAEFRAAKAIQTFWRSQYMINQFMRIRTSAISLQSHFRGHAARCKKENAEIKSVIIQKLVRGYFTRLQDELERRRASIIIIQCKVRQFFAVNKLRRMKNDFDCRNIAAIVCQRNMRMLSAMKCYKVKVAQYRASRKLQAMWRSCQQRKLFLKGKEGAILIQSFYRGCVVRSIVNTMTMNAIVVQKTWRSFSAQLQYELQLMDIIFMQCLIRRWMAHNEYLKRQSSVLSIQCVSRQWLAARRLRLLQEEMHWEQKCIAAATICQKYARKLIASKSYQHQLVKYRAAKSIQSQWRSSCQQKRYHSSRSSLILCQACVRGYSARREMNISKFNATKIQTVWRVFSAQLHYESNLMDIILVQSLIRRRISYHQVLQRHASVLRIQQLSRQYLAVKKKEQLAEEKQCTQAATICQQYIRRFLATSRFRPQIIHNIAAKTVQKLWRTYYHETRFAGIKRGVILIQSSYRAYAARKEREITTKKIILIQTRWRCFCSQQKYDSLLTSIISIQSLHRQRALTAELSMRRLSILKIQSLFRQQLALKSLQTLKTERDECNRQIAAAVFCQKFVRKFLAANHFEQKLLCHRATRSIQTWWRARMQSQQYMRVIASTIRIQCSYRGHALRTILDRRKSNAIRIQSAWRMFYSWRQYLFDKMDIVFIQSMVRRRQAIFRYLEMRSAIITIQCAARSWFAVKKTRAIEKEREEKIRYDAAVLLCQSAFRRQISRKKYRCALASIVIIQSSVRRWISIHRIQRRRYDISMAACSKIQKAVRGLQARSVYRQYKSACLIQTKWRGYVAYANYKSSVISAIKIQAFVRCQNHKRHFSRLCRAVIAVQAVFRGLREREARQKQILATVVLQSWMRVIVSASLFKRKRSSAVVLQRTVRGMITRSEMELHQFAASEIQIAWKCYQSRRVYSATVIQRVVRGMIARGEINLQFFAATEIQRVWRGHRVSEGHNSTVTAAIKIESLVRQMIARKTFSSYKLDQLRREHHKRVLANAASIIQSFYRNILFQRKLKNKLVIAQSAVRGFLARRQKDKLMKAILFLQSLYRAGKTRKSMTKKARAASLRIERANRAAVEKPQMKLGVRTKAALEVLLTSKRLAEVMRAVTTLEVSTRFSEKCCVAFAQAKAPGILYALIRTCNRSLPHMELLNFVLETLTNVASHSYLVRSVATSRSVEVLIDLVQMFRDKDNIFCLAISLLGHIVCAVDECMVRCASRENLKRLKGIHSLSLRKIEMSSRTEKGRRQSVGNHDRRRKMAQSSIARKRKDVGSEGMADLRNGVRALENILRCIRDYKPKQIL